MSVAYITMSARWNSTQQMVATCTVYGGCVWQTLGERVVTTKQGRAQ